MIPEDPVRQVAQQQALRDQPGALVFLATIFSAVLPGVNHWYVEVLLHYRNGQKETVLYQVFVCGGTLGAIKIKTL
jgi:hypothetical protein